MMTYNYVLSSVDAIFMYIGVCSGGNLYSTYSEPSTCKEKHTLRKETRT